MENNTNKNWGMQATDKFLCENKYKVWSPNLVCALFIVSGLILGADGKLPYCSCNLCSYTKCFLQTWTIVYLLKYLENFNKLLQQLAWLFM